MAILGRFRRLSPLLFRAATVAVLLAALYPYLVSRIWTLSTLIANSPTKLREVRTFSEHSPKFRHAVRNCEDAVIVEGTGSAILSCDPGRDLWNTVMGTFEEDFSAVPPGELVLYRYHPLNHATANELSRIRLLGFSDASQFHPLGIEYHPASAQLFVCNHPFDGPRVEIFKLDLASHPPTARHIRTVTHPLIRSPNSIVARNGHELFVTNDHFFKIRNNPALAKIETYGGLPLGNVVHILLHEDSPATIRSVARVPYANGVTLLNSSVLAVASTSSCQVRLYKLRPDGRLDFATTIHVPLMPDNLSTDGQGTLLIGGHPHPPSLEMLVAARQDCIQDPSMLEECHSGSAPSWVSEWTAEKGLRTLYATRSEFGSSSSAVRDTEFNVGIITGLYEKGILTWKE